MAVKNFFYSFLLLALFVFKVSAAHVYTHQDDNVQIEDCELCEHAFQNQNAEFSFVAPTTIPEEPTALIVILPVNSFDTPFVSNTLLFRPFSRPPPTI